MHASMTDSNLDARSIQRDLTRAATFLGGLSRSPAIWRIVAEKAGYTQEIHNQGWATYLRVMGYIPPGQAPSETPTPQSAAIAELDSWDGPAFTRAKAALSVAYPAVSEKLFRGLEATEGPAAVASVSTFLERVRALRDGTPDERAAATLLVARKILDPASEKQLTEWLDRAKQGAPPAAPVASLESDPEYQAAARALHNFLTDWRTQARAVLTRRDYLIRLGLAERRKKTGSAADGSDTDDSDLDDAIA